MPSTRAAFTEEQLIRFAEAVVAPLRAPMVVVDEHLKVVAASDAFRQLLPGSADPRGKELLSLAQGRWDVPKLRQALENVLPEQRSFDDLEVPDHAGRPIYVGGRALHTEAGLPKLVLLSFGTQQSRERTQYFEELNLTEEIVATVREPLLVLEYDHRVRLANQSFYRDFRVSPGDVTGRPLRDLGNGQWDIPELRQQLDRILSHDRSFNDFEVEHDFDDIGRRTILLNARRIDHLRLILLAFEDVTERRRLRRQQELLVSELAHRNQNLLAVVQSLASQTSGATVDEYRSAFVGRIGALAAAHQVLIQSRWQKAELHDVLRHTLAPFLEEETGQHIQGPPVGLTPEQATAIALIVHELATNAAKYGALSRSGGNVSVTWGTTARDVWLEWREGGGPSVSDRGTAGFGTTLIEGTASYQLGGQADLRFERDGLVCRLRFSL